MALTTHRAPSPAGHPTHSATVFTRSKVSEIEPMPYSGESASDRTAFARYIEEVKRGKSLLMLIAMRDALTPEIRKCWYSSTFTPVENSEGVFDALTCNLAYHFNKHGSAYGTIAEMTEAAQRYFALNQSQAVWTHGKLKLPMGTFMPDGRIVTFW